MKPVTFEDQYSNQRPLKGLSIKVIIGMLIIGLIALAFSAQATDGKENADIKSESKQAIAQTFTAFQTFLS